MEIEALPAIEYGGGLVVMALVFLGVFIIANSKFLVKYILLRKNILMCDTTFKPKKLNIIFAVISIPLCAIISALTALDDALLNAFTNAFMLLAICQAIYFIIRLIFDAKNKIHVY